MKTLIVYYSLDGNTALIAKKMATYLQADLLQLYPEKEYPTGKVRKYLWGGKSVLFGDIPKLKEYKVSLDTYDTILIGTPIWASTYAPPIKTFLVENEIKNKKVAFFACHGGGGADKCFAKLKEHLPQNEGMQVVDFFDPTKGKDIDFEAKVKNFCEKIQE
jgi:flavodoxin